MMPNRQKHFCNYKFVAYMLNMYLFYQVLRQYVRHLFRKVSCWKWAILYLKKNKTKGNKKKFIKSLLMLLQ